MNDKPFGFLGKRDTPINLKKTFQDHLIQAKANDVSSQYYIGWALEFGYGAKKNLTQAKIWYRLAAENGHNEAANNLTRVDEKLTALQRQSSWSPDFQHHESQASASQGTPTVSPNSMNPKQ